MKANDSLIRYLKLLKCNAQHVIGRTFPEILSLRSTNLHALRRRERYGTAVTLYKKCLPDRDVPGTTVRSYAANIRCINWRRLTIIAHVDSVIDPSTGPPTR